MSAAAVLAMLRKMTREQYDRWKQGRFNAFSAQERKAIQAFEAEASNQKTPAGTGA